MDQISIGKFIAKMRKEKSYTQRQLADLLKISDKTISKWETGNGLPEVSLMLPLCEALGISVNELLTGEKVADADYKKKAEENMMNLMREREENKQKMVLVVAVGGISTISFVTLLLVVCVYTEVIALPIKIVLISIACIIFATGIYFAMQGERTVGYYQCKHCDETFVPGFLEYMAGAHMLTTRYLKCPHCGKKSWCKKILSKSSVEKQ
ncbi:MAG: helix-turn-helix transcriptional regulator [Lachnospiraceae bacterium]|nr:helix-turn-helix transcriptional regulator [Lachnospiraceae bacterium]